MRLPLLFGLLAFGLSTQGCRLGVDDQPTGDETCQANSIGYLRQNPDTDNVEVCDGKSWREFSFGPRTASLVVLPSEPMDMDVVFDGTNVPSLGAERSLSVVNLGLVPSSTLSVAVLGDSRHHFVLTKDECRGQMLEPRGACELRLRSQAEGDGRFTATLEVQADNRPIALLKGEARGFGCTPGVPGAGGIYVACAVRDGSSTYDLVALPSGCDGGVDEPTCAGVDAVIKAWSSQPVVRGDLVKDPADGAQNSVNLLAYAEVEGLNVHPAVEYCMAMVKDGYDDWYLPASNELFVVYELAAQGKVGGFSSAWYRASDELDADYAASVDFSSGRVDPRLWGIKKTNGIPARCVRRHGVALPIPEYDLTPDGIALKPSSASAPSTRLTSEAIRVSGVTRPVSVSVVGEAGDPSFRINDGPETKMATANWGDEIRLVATSPSGAGLEHWVSFAVGTTTHLWLVRTYDRSSDRRVFVTSAAYRGYDLHGLASVDAVCQSHADAAGLGGTWMAVVSGWAESAHARNRVPFNWGSLLNMRGEVVAVGFDDLWDGEIAHPVQYDENREVVADFVWTASDTSGRASSDGNCGDWSSEWNSDLRYGHSSMSGAGWVSAGAADCEEMFNRLYCMEDTPSGTPDATPIPFLIRTSHERKGSRVTSAEFIIRGIDDSQASASVSAPTDAAAALRVDGGPEVLQALVRNGQRLVLTANVPDAGKELIVDVRVGTYATTWQVLGHDGSQKRAFVTSTQDDGRIDEQMSASGADLKCQNLANSATLGGVWKAILSNGYDVNEYANRRIGWNWERLVNMNGEIVADRWTDLWEGALVHPIRYDESRTPRDVFVFTGSTARGDAELADDRAHCKGWTSADTASTSGRGGRSDATTSDWISHSNLTCATRNHFYCIEQ